MTKTILAMGQSNCVGITPGGIWAIPSSVKAWNCTPNTDSTSGLGSEFVTPSSPSACPFNNGNNMMAHACRYLSAELGEDVNLIVVAFVGKSISWWMNSAGVAGPMYTRMVNVLAAAGVSKVDAFMWHQGEADNLAPAGYDGAWAALLSRMTADGYIDTATPIVIGEVIAQDYPINVVLRAIADADPRVGIADLATFPLAADLHFDGPSYVRAGLEYAREIMKLPGPFHMDPTPFENAYVTGAGLTALSMPSGVFVKVPLKAENGKKSLIDGTGAFVADRTGVWEFQGRGCAFSPHVSLSILDETGAYLQSLGQFVTASTSFKPVISGSAVMALGRGDRVWLGLYQGSGAAINIPIQNSSLFNRMTVKFLGSE